MDTIILLSENNAAVWFNIDDTTCILLVFWSAMVSLAVSTNSVRFWDTDSMLSIVTFVYIIQIIINEYNYVLTCNRVLNPSVTSVVAHESMLGGSQLKGGVHLLVAIDPLGPLGHGSITVLLTTVSGQSNWPLTVDIVSLLQEVKPMWHYY